jgi:hypothetical protein
MTRVRYLLAGLLVGIPLLLIQAGPALACTCNRVQVDAALADSDGAFVGVLVGQDFLALGEVKSVDPELSVVNHFEVEWAVKGAIGESVDVLASASGGSCGLELAVGQRSGLLLRRGITAWESSMCQKTDPDALLAVAAEKPNTAPVPAFSVPEMLQLFVAIGVVLLAIPLGLALRRVVRRRS